MKFYVSKSWILAGTLPPHSRLTIYVSGVEFCTIANTILMILIDYCIMFSSSASAHATKEIIINIQICIDDMTCYMKNKQHKIATNVKLTLEIIVKHNVKAQLIMPTALLSSTDDFNNYHLRLWWYGPRRLKINDKKEKLLYYVMQYLVKV